MALSPEEIERYARAGIKSVMTFGVSHHLDANGSDTWREDGLVSRMGLAGARLDEVSAGAVLKHSRDFNLTRESVLGSALSKVPL